MTKSEWEAYYGQDTKLNKYGARKVVVDGVTFDSSKEYIRWRELQLLERGGEISGKRNASSDRAKPRKSARRSKARPWRR